MEHIGIAENEVCACANRTPRVLWCIAVVRERADRLPGAGLEGFAERMQLGELVLRQGLGGKQIERPARRVLQDRIQNRDVVAQRLARGRRCDHDCMAVGHRMADGFCLMAVKLGDATRLERCPQPMVDSVRTGRVLGDRRRQAPDGGNVELRGVGTVGSLATKQPPERGIKGVISDRGDSGDRGLVSP